MARAPPPRRADHRLLKGRAQECGARGDGIHRMGPSIRGTSESGSLFHCLGPGMRAIDAWDNLRLKQSVDIQFDKFAKPLSMYCEEEDTDNWTELSESPAFVQVQQVVGDRYSLPADLFCKKASYVSNSEVAQAYGVNCDKTPAVPSELEHLSENKATEKTGSQTFNLDFKNISLESRDVTDTSRFCGVFTFGDP